MVSCAKPWDSTDAGSWMYNDEGRWVRSDLAPQDSQAQIELCLTCPFDDCVDCVASRQVKRTDLIRKIRQLTSRKRGVRRR